MGEPGQRWYTLRGDEAAKAVISITDALAQDDGRAVRLKTAQSLYDADGVRNVAVQGVDTRYNVSRSAVDTAQAEIAARQRPKPMFLTSGADWKTKRKAKKLDRFVEGQLHQRQGCYADAWELGEDMFRTASIAVGAVAKVTADVNAEKVRIEHIPADEVLVDPDEARGGDPQNWFHVYTMDLDAAIEAFCGEDSAESDDDDEREGETKKMRRQRIEEALRAASLTEVSKNTLGSLRFRLHERVKIREAWRLPISSKKPGRHVFACDQGCLHEEDWLWPFPPLAILVWSRELFGIWGKGLVEEGATQHARVQEIAERVHERFDACAQKVVYYVAGTVDEAAMQSNDSVIFVPVTSMAEVPQERNVPPITPAEGQFLAEELQRYYEMQGVSQMSAQSRKDPGVDAAVAIQTLNDIKSVRFMPKARAYELLFVRLGELIVRAARDLAVAKPDLVAKWPGHRFLEDIPWSEVDMPEDMYECRVAPVSAMSRDPAQRMQIVEQMAAAGRIPQSTYFQLIGQPDLDSLLQLESAEARWVEKLMDRFLDAEDDDHLDELGGYDAPDGFFAKPLAALVAVQQMYFESKCEGAPAYNLELLERYILDLQKIIEKATMPPPAPPGATMPGAGGPPLPMVPPSPMPVPGQPPIAA